MGLSTQDGANSSVTAQGNLAQLPIPVAGEDKPVLRCRPNPTAVVWPLARPDILYCP